MQNVLNCLRVLDEVAARQPVGVGEVARIVQMPKTSVQRALKTLQEAGWIRAAEGEPTRWMMTTKAFQLSYRATELSLRDAAMPVMEELREQTDETIHLMVPDGDVIVLIERLQTRQPVRIVLPLGTSLPMHASANGKAVLAHSSPTALERYLDRDLPTYTTTTIADRSDLLAELAQVRRRGYATNSGEWRADVAAVAAAVLGHDGGEPIASLSVSTPAVRMPERTRAKYGALVKAAADDLRRLLSGEPTS